MIDEQATFEKYGYYSTDLSYGSGKRVVAVCDDCGAIRYPEKRHHRSLCFVCSKKSEYVSDKTRLKMSITRRKAYAEDTGKAKHQSITMKKLCTNNPELIERHSIATKKAHADDPMLAELQSLALKKTYADDPTLKERISAAGQGIPYEDWTGFATENQYCEKFDEACRERIREKYDRKCFLCNENEMDNKEKLCVHHYDMNKDDGCNGNLWKLVPLCRCCHGSAHSKMWTTRIEYLLANVWE